jgi:small GTP-binding protein
MDSPIESLKIVLVGEAGVGKTSIISQFVEQVFQEDIQSSTGGTFSSKTCTYGNNKILKLEIWDTAGQEKYRSLTNMFYNEANAAILVYDITVKASYEQVKEYWSQKVKESAPNDIIIAICGNKSDLIDLEQVDEEEARKFANEIGAMYCSTSAKNDYGINNLFLQIAKKYTGCDNVTFNNDNEDSTIRESSEQTVRQKQRGSVRITHASFSQKNKKVEEHKKKCC